jgi:hypothetical protein
VAADLIALIAMRSPLAPVDAHEAYGPKTPPYLSDKRVRVRRRFRPPGGPDRKVLYAFLAADS